MSRRTVLRSAAALALAAVLVLALALPALAASGGSGSITINPNGQAKVGGADRFTAYQIFKGTVGTNPNELDNLNWGDGVDSDVLVGLMKGSSLTLAGSTFGDVFTAAWTDWNDKLSREMNEAEFVAQWLGQHLTDRAYADDFARLVALCTTTTGTKSAFNLGETAWVIDNLDPGYYLVVDGYHSGSEAPDGSVSSYILQVVGTAEIDLKATIPTVEKKVDGAKGVLTETEVEHTFTLTGTVSQNIGEYGTYSYKFTDTISAGLTVTPNQLAGLTVTYSNTSGATTSATFTKGAGYDYTVDISPAATQEGEHTLTVTFTDLKAALQRRVSGIDLSDTNLVNNIKIVVTYKAQLNKNAVIGKDGNPNDVVLEYSNDPYGGGKGQTQPSEVKTYTLALRIVKKGADGILPGAEFKLMQGQNNDPNAAGAEFATFNSGSGQDVEGIAETYQEISGWKAGINNGGTLTTDAQGVFNIHGLSAGTYTLVETKAPEGYETMKPIVFTIAGSVDGTGALGTVN